ncbi:hypothetical protein K466DRAFT_51003 [Polyporus arcularius HHB13444]|uniref:F-box domain-containing protein n=1 Tax=Polyporus arcularius HHB13444 TaxID=1314778 RepID=A0A5C3PL67_9APHY|nr:hypothetical protein K466DRAFT_51003 [Polyporus arcularius HHB13444]
MLHRISSDAHFAGQVRVVNVGAFCCKHEVCSRGISGLLVDALRCLTALESFAYFGDRPVLSVELFDALAAGSAETLRHIRLPAGWNLDTRQLKATLSLKSIIIGRIRETDLEPYPPPPDSNLAKSTHTVRALADAGTKTLQRIRVPDFTWFDPAALSNLVEVELTYLHGREVDINIVLTHFPRLRSLVLVSVEHRHVALFDAHPTALPLLESLDISARYYIPVAHFTEFIVAKKHLRRLNVMTCDVRMELLDLLPRLPRLEVLGLDLWCYDWTEERHEKLDKALPAGLTALLIWDGMEESFVSKAAWARLLQKRTALRYFHVLPETERDADISAELLEHRPPSLELVGLGWKIRSVERLSESDSESRDGDDAHTHSYSEPWSLAKVWFRAAEDFGDPDWEWLLRGHNASMFKTAHVLE